MKWEGISNDIAMAFSVGLRYANNIMHQTQEKVDAESHKRRDDREICSVGLFVYSAVPGWGNEAQAVISMPYVRLVKLPLGLCHCDSKQPALQVS